MKKKAITAAEPESETRVLLKPIFGVRPRTYVAAGYAVFILGLLFFLLFVPGLSKSGSLVRIESLPEGASVNVDGVRVGFSPASVFIPNGKRSIVVQKPRFTSRELSVDVPGRIFASLFFPKKITVRVDLELGSPRDLLNDAHREFSSWVLTGEPTPNYQFPPVLSEAAADYALAKGTGGDELWDMLRSAAAGVNSPGAFKDYARAVLLAGSGGGALSPQGFARSARFLLSMYGGGDSAAYWLSAVLPETAASAYASSAEAASESERLSARLKAELRRPAPPSAAPAYRLFSGGEFVQIPGGAYYRGWAGISDAAAPRDSLSPPHPAAVGSFLLKTAEVTEEEFAAFIRENPRWAPSNRSALVRDGLAEESYLSSWKDSPTPPEPAFPVREVSYFAAAAYCGWLEGKNPGYRFYLPSETEWEYAASLNMAADGSKSSPRGLQPAAAGARGRAGLRFSEGNLWEWCSDRYFPASYIFSAAGDFPVSERVVRGGSWINAEGSVSVSTRGSQPPTWCTPYLGFRPAAGPIKAGL